VLKRETLKIYPNDFKSGVLFLKIAILRSWGFVLPPLFDIAPLSLSRDWRTRWNVINKTDNFLL